MKSPPPKKNQIEAIDALEQALDRLKLAYEKYFRGIERRPPVHERMALEREVREFFRSPPRTAAARFRFSNFRQRMTALETYWNRVMRQIEEGTYERDVRRARSRMAAAAGEDRPRSKAIELDLELDLDFDMDELFEEASQSVAAHFERPEPPKPQAPKRAVPPPAPPAALAPKRVKGAAPPPPPPAALAAAPPPPPASALRRAERAMPPLAPPLAAPPVPKVKEG